MEMSLTGRKTVMTGMGSAYAENQRMAGAQDPETSAIAAGENLSASELQEYEEKKNEVNLAVKDGYNLKQDITLDNVDAILEDVDQWRSDKIDEELYPVLTPDDPLYNPMMDVRRKKAIESNLTPIDFEDMIFKGYSDQEIEIRAGFRIVFRTMTTQQSLWIEQRMRDVAEEVMQYGRHYMSIVQIACCLQSVNGRPIGSSLSTFVKPSQKDEFNDALERKLEAVLQMPQVITDDLIVNFTWFQGRVRKALAGDVGRKVGN